MEFRKASSYRVSSFLLLFVVSIYYTDNLLLYSFGIQTVLQLYCTLGLSRSSIRFRPKLLFWTWMPLTMLTRKCVCISVWGVLVGQHLPHCHNTSKVPPSKVYFLRVINYQFCIITLSLQLRTKVFWKRPFEIQTSRHFLNVFFVNLCEMSKAVGWWFRNRGKNVKIDAQEFIKVRLDVVRFKPF